MVSFKNIYTTLAASLALTGILLTALAFWVLRSTPLTALGISTVLIGAVSFAISRGQPKIPPEASAILLQSGVENISALIEELGLNSKAIYLPSSLSGDKPKALIPLDSNVKLSDKVLPKRLIVKYGSAPEAAGLLITTVGSVVGAGFKVKPDYTAPDLESAISQAFLGAINLADGVRVKLGAEQVLVEVDNPRLEPSKMLIYEMLGSPTASIVASVVAQILDKPVSVISETFEKRKCVIELKIMERNF